MANSSSLAIVLFCRQNSHSPGPQFENQSGRTLQCYSVYKSIYWPGLFQ